LSKKHHPDAGGDPEKFVQIKAAYDVLNSPEQRKIFDEIGVMPGTEEYKIMDEAINHIGNAFEQMMNVVAIDNLEKTNFLELCRENIDNSVRTGARQIADVEAALLRCERAKRIFQKKMKKKKKKSPHIFLNFTEIKIKQISMTLVAMQRTHKVFVKAAEILQDYEFIQDKEDEDSVKIGVQTRQIPTFKSSFKGLF
jgi:curved DNA-binding protein CbpA